MLELGLPDLEELRGLFEVVRGRHPDVEVAEGEDVDALLKGAVGLTADEADRAFAKLFMGRKRVGAELLSCCTRKSGESSASRRCWISCRRGRGSSTSAGWPG